MIDLHTHTTESDGTYSPEELVLAALHAKLTALAITDHDTLSGYRFARPHAESAGLRLVCGIEVSTVLEMPVRRTVHLLGYFPKGEPAGPFTDWITEMQESRRDRNRRLIKRLNSLGIDIDLHEVEAVGRSMTGRPHFARLLVAKGYAEDIPDAFAKYLDEKAPGYVERNEPTFGEGVRRINDAGGISSLAHPIRLGKRNPQEEEELIASMVDQGLRALECYHSDHSEADTQRYLNLAAKYGLRVTGGSDFHGANKPSIALGTGYRGNLRIPPDLLRTLEE